MKPRDEGTQDEKVAVPTVKDFLRVARNRRKELKVKMDRWGVQLVTDGQRWYPLPRLRGGRMPFLLVAALCEFFELPPEDFGLDPGPED